MRLVPKPHGACRQRIPARTPCTLRGRFQPLKVSCGARPSVNASAGASFPMIDPAPISSDCPRSTRSRAFPPLRVPGANSGGTAARSSWIADSDTPLEILSQTGSKLARGQSPPAAVSGGGAGVEVRAPERTARDPNRRSCADLAWGAGGRRRHGRPWRGRCPACMQGAIVPVRHGPGREVNQQY